jgi:hypothetical protein
MLDFYRSRSRQFGRTSPADVVLRLPRKVDIGKAMAVVFTVEDPGAFYEGSGAGTLTLAAPIGEPCSRFLPPEAG